MQLSGNTVLITGGASGIDSDCQADPSPQEFVAGRMQGLRNDVPEIGFGLNLAPSPPVSRVMTTPIG